MRGQKGDEGILFMEGAAQEGDRAAKEVLASIIRTIGRLRGLWPRHNLPDQTLGPARMDRRGSAPSYFFGWQGSTFSVVKNTSVSTKIGSRTGARPVSTR